MAEDVEQKGMVLYLGSGLHPKKIMLSPVNKAQSHSHSNDDKMLFRYS